MPQTERIPPHSEEAETSVLGAILMDKDAFLDVSEVVTADDFYSPAHQEIFRAMIDLFERDQAIDSITVSDSLKKRGSLEAAGGMQYIAWLSTITPTAANAAQYAEIIAEKAMLRSLIKTAGEIMEEGYSEKLDSTDVLDRAEQSIFSIAKDRQSSEYRHIKDVLRDNLELIREAEKNGGHIPGLSTGFKDLDSKTTGLQKSDLIIIAARPSMGKTAFALNIAQNAAFRAGAKVVIFSLEMGDTQLGNRMLAMEARVDSKKLRTGDLTPEDWESINMAVEKLSESRIIIEDTPGINVMEIRNKCRRISAEGPIDLVVIDYLQMMGTTGRSENRQQEVSTISRSLKQLARELECPVIVLSQLSRAVESVNRSDKRPLLSDLRESGAIEQDADVVMFLYRQDYYRKPEEEKDNTCEIIIAKQRNGETGTAKLMWLPKYTKFADMFKEPKA